MKFISFLCFFNRNFPSSFDSKLMAAPPARARADYDYLIKLLLIGDSGKSLTMLWMFCLILRQLFVFSPYNWKSFLLVIFVLILSLMYLS